MAFGIPAFKVDGMDALSVYLAAQEANRIRRSGQRPVMDRRIECDGSIIVMGEDVHRLKGGTNGATRGRREARHAPAPGPGLRKAAPRGPAPVEDFDYVIPLGKAKVVRAGRDLTVLTCLSMAEATRAAAERLGVDAEIVDLRSLDRAGMDWATIEQSIRKTGNVLIVEQGAAGTSYGGWLADELQRRVFDWLDQPIRRVHGTRASPSVSKALEAAACARLQDIGVARRSVMAAQGRSLS